MARQKFSAPSPPIRSQFYSSDPHDNHPSNCGYVQGEGDSIDSLFEQFPGVGSEQDAVDFSHGSEQRKRPTVAQQIQVDSMVVMQRTLR